MWASAPGHSFPSFCLRQLKLGWSQTAGALELCHYLNNRTWQVSSTFPTAVPWGKDIPWLKTLFRCQHGATLETLPSCVGAMQYKGTARRRGGRLFLLLAGGDVAAGRTPCADDLRWTPGFVAMTVLLGAGAAGELAGYAFSGATFLCCRINALRRMRTGGEAAMPCRYLP